MLPTILCVQILTCWSSKEISAQNPLVSLQQFSQFPLVRVEVQSVKVCCQVRDHHQLLSPKPPVWVLSAYKGLDCISHCLHPLLGPTQ